MDPYGIYLRSKRIHLGVIWVHIGARWDPYEIQMDPSGIHLDPNGIQLWSIWGHMISRNDPEFWMSETDTKTQLLFNFKWLHMESIWIQMGSRCNSYGSIWDPDVIHMDPYGMNLGWSWNQHFLKQASWKLSWSYSLSWSHWGWLQNASPSEKSLEIIYFNLGLVGWPTFHTCPQGNSIRLGLRAWLQNPGSC